MPAETRSSLIDAAERVFARDGFTGASLREIMRDAGANPAAVHYHFGGKDGLLTAVLDRVIEPITTARLAGLAALRADHPTGPLPIEPLVEAFVRPDVDAIVELQRRGPGRAAVVGHAYGRADEHVRTLVGRQFAPVAEAFLPEFRAALRHLPDAVVEWRLRWCVVGVIVSLFSNADVADGPFDGVDPETVVVRLVDVVVGVLTAPHHSHRSQP